ncbi:hypothetical protein Hanom_Chr12g01070871 [Helianthus anomalus]
MFYTFLIVYYTLRFTNRVFPPAACRRNARRGKILVSILKYKVGGLCHRQYSLLFFDKSLVPLFCLLFLPLSLLRAFHHRNTDATTPPAVKPLAHCSHFYFVSGSDPKGFLQAIFQITTIGFQKHKIHKIKVHKKSSNFTKPRTDSTNGFRNFTSTISNRVEGFKVAAILRARNFKWYIIFAVKATTIYTIRCG